MLVLITYDVSTESKEGRKRLSRVAKKCVAHGQRVQNSVFECLLNWNQYVKLQNELKQIIDTSQDSLRFYNLGNKFNSKIISMGKEKTVPVYDTLIL